MTARLMLLDSASLYFRAFYGVPEAIAPDGTPINAVRGMLDIVAKLITTYRPSQVVACWDDDWRPQWRVDLIPSYKTHRVAEVVELGPDVEEVPDPLDIQVPVIRETLELLGIPVVGAPNYEADDIIGTLATKATIPVDVVTGDRDLFQLVDDARDVRVVYTARGMSNLDVITDQVVVERYGVHASQYADFATLRGDSSDGLPGVPGVGEKTAASLLQSHGTLAGIIDAAERGEGMTPRIQSKIRESADYLAVAPTVVAVATSIDIDVPDLPLASLTGDRERVAQDWADRWALGGSMDRALAALADVAG